MLRIIVFFLLVFVTPSVEIFSTEDWHKEVEGTPLDVAAGRVLEAYFAFSSAGMDLKPVTPTRLFELEQAWKKSAARLADHVLAEGLEAEFAGMWRNADEVHRAALGMSVRDIRAFMNSRILDTGILPEEGSPALMFPRYEPLESWDYAYGKEISREVVDKYESIIRQTFFENRTHNVDIQLDFLEPIRKIITKLNLKSMFEWLWDSKLFYGYHSSFVHHKKVFIRFKAFNQKVAVKVEVLRRKRYWWGYGDWEIYGSTTRMMEEPTAVVGREVEELD